VEVTKWSFSSSYTLLKMSEPKSGSQREVSQVQARKMQNPHKLLHGSNSTFLCKSALVVSPLSFLLIYSILELSSFSRNHLVRTTQTHLLVTFFILMVTISSTKILFALRAVYRLDGRAAARARCLSALSVVLHLVCLGMIETIKSQLQHSTQLGLFQARCPSRGVIILLAILDTLTFVSFSKLGKEIKNGDVFDSENSRDNRTFVQRLGIWKYGLILHLLVITFWITHILVVGSILYLYGWDIACYLFGISPEVAGMGWMLMITSEFYLFCVGTKAVFGGDHEEIAYYSTSQCLCYCILVYYVWIRAIHPILMASPHAMLLSHLSSPVLVTLFVVLRLILIESFEVYTKRSHRILFVASSCQIRWRRLLHLVVSPVNLMA